MKNWSQETAATFFANCSIWLKLLINRVDWIALMQMAHFWANLKVDMVLLESFYDGKVSFEEQNWLENALILLVKSLRKSDKLSLLGFYSLWDPILLFHFGPTQPLDLGLGNYHIFLHYQNWCLFSMLWKNKIIVV